MKTRLIGTMLAIMAVPALAYVEIRTGHECMAVGPGKFPNVVVKPEHSGRLELHASYYLRDLCQADPPALDYALYIDGQRVDPWQYMNLVGDHDSRTDLYLHFARIDADTIVRLRIGHEQARCLDHKAVMIAAYRQDHEAAEFGAPYAKHWHLQRLGLAAD